MLLMMCSMLVAQQADAAETFKHFEQVLSQAQTVRLKFKGRQEVTLNGAAPKSFEYSGELSLKGPNKAFFKLLTGNQEIVMASDGSTLQAGIGGAARRRESPADLRARFFEPSVTRAGLLGILAIPTGYTGKDVEDRRTAFTCSGYRPLEPEDKLRRIGYTVKALPAGRTFEMTLAFDASTGLPRKRTLVGEDAASKSVVVETCEEWILGSDIADAAFTLPGAK